MPVKECEEDDKPGYKWGDSGKCYTYTAGDEKARKEAKQKAHIQGSAIKAKKEYAIDPALAMTGECWVPILRTGTYPQRGIGGEIVSHEVTDDMLGKVVSNFNPDSFAPGVNKYKHTDPKRFGDVKELKDEGGKLLAKFAITDPETREEMVQGRLPYRSPRFSYGDNGWELEHLTLLASVPPKVRTLDRIGYSLSYSEDGKTKNEFYDFNVEEEEIMDEEKVAKSLYEQLKLLFSKEEKPVKDKDKKEITEVEFAELKRERDDLTHERNDLKKKVDDLQQTETDRKTEQEKGVILAKYEEEIGELKGKKFPTDLMDGKMEFAKGLSNDLQTEKLEEVLEADVALLKSIPDQVNFKTEPVEGKDAEKLDMATPEGQVVMMEKIKAMKIENPELVKDKTDSELYDIVKEEISETVK